MTSIAALCKAFLSGKTISIKTGFNDFGITNIPREVGRSIERKFGVAIDRTAKTGKSKYGQSVSWFEYRLLYTNANAEGIKKMAEYLLQHDNNIQKTSFKTDKEAAENKQTSKQESIF